MLAWLRLAQAVEHVARGKAVRNLPDRGLKVADGDAGARAEQTVGLADIEAAPRQQLLQLVALVAASARARRAASAARTGRRRAAGRRDGRWPAHRLRPDCIS